MLSHRVGGAGPTPRRAPVGNNENGQMKSLSSSAVNDNAPPTTSHKTPARSVGKRRAFGDISNRKQPPSSTTAQQWSTQLGGATTRKPSNKTVSFHQPQPTPHQSTLLKPSSSKSTVSRSAVLVQETPFASENKVDFTVPTRTTTTPATAAPKHMEEPTQVESKTILLEDDLDEEEVDDIELPAGRLWKDQHNDDYDDETTISIEGLQSYSEILRKRFEFEERLRQIQAEEAEEELDREIQAMWKRDDEDWAADHAWKPQDGDFETSIEDLLNTLEGFELSLQTNSVGIAGYRGLDDDISI